ncbi:Retrovirus-related Pol polyprotein from transposon RE1 [Linum perenne]
MSCWICRAVDVHVSICNRCNVTKLGWWPKVSVKKIDFFNTFNPLIKPTTIRLVLSIALSKRWNIRQLDINNVFLNGDLAEEVYMKQLRGFEDTYRSTHVCKLHKSIYGLKQAPRAWFTKLKSYLISQRFMAFHSDTSLFVRVIPSAVVYILDYVNDLIITGSDASQIQAFITNLNHMFLLKDLGTLNHFLGIQIKHHNGREAVESALEKLAEKQRLQIEKERGGNGGFGH